MVFSGLFVLSMDSAATVEASQEQNYIN